MANRFFNLQTHPHVILLYLLVGLFVLPPRSRAQTPPAEGEELPEIVIVAPSVINANKLDKFGGLITEVSSDQVDDLNAIDLASALRRTPGVTISRFNPVGSFGGGEGGAIFIRGAGASRPGSELKTYIDGIPLYMGVWNHALLDLLPVQGMDRIDVHKGPQPHSFGNTFAAVNLIPARAFEDGTSTNLHLAGGSYSTIVEHLNVKGKQGNVDYTLSQQFARSNGHRSNADGRLINGFLRSKYTFNPTWSAEFFIFHADNTASDPGRLNEPDTRAGIFDTRGTLAALSVQHLTQNTSGRLQVYLNTGMGHWKDHPLDPDTRSDFDLAGVRFREDLTLWTGGFISAGLDIDRIDGEVAFDGETGFEGEEITILSPSLSISHQHEVAPFLSITPSAGLRHYCHSIMENEIAPHAGIVLDFGGRLNVRTTFSRGFNYPGLDAAVLNAIIPPLAATPDGWRDLRPEQLDHFEAGLFVSLIPGFNIDLTFFEDQYTNRYVFAFPPVVSAPGFTNVGDFEVRGFESSFQYQTQTLSLFAGLTLFDPSRNDQPYTPDAAAVIGGNVQYGAWSFHADAQVQSDMHVLSTGRAEGNLSTVEVDGFSILNLRVANSSQWLGSQNEIFVFLENVLDRTYEYRPAYPMPGRSIQFGVRIGL